MNTALNNSTEAPETLVSALTSALVEVMKVQCNYEVVPQCSFSFDENSQILSEVCSKIVLKGPQFDGVLYFCLGKSVFLALMGKMFGEEFTEITSELRDGAAELLNICFGVAKTKLRSRDIVLEMAIPTMIEGDEIPIMLQRLRGIPVIPLETQQGKIHLLVAVRSH